MNDAASDYAIARRVLCDYHPLEPEMILQLFMQQFPQVMSGSTNERLVAPVPWRHTVSKRMEQYTQCKWRRETMPFIEFLRKSNKDGSILQAYTRRYKAAQDAGETEASVEEWIQTAEMHGEKTIAAAYLSRYNDAYYGQWVMMN